VSTPLKARIENADRPRLLADAKLREDAPKDILGIGASNDLIKRAQRFTNISDENRKRWGSSRRRGKRAKLAPLQAEETESDYRREFRKSSWAACIKRIYEIDPLGCPKCKAQMGIISFIQDEHCHLAKAKRRRAIKDIMKSQGIPDFQAPPPIPNFIDAVKAIDELPSYNSFEPSPDDF
jgi:hypothetical protein